VRARYELRLSGPLDAAVRDALAGLDCETHGELTIVTATLDQAALHGLLERVRASGIELVELRRTRGSPRRRPMGGSAP
jgi:hypothetical protein